MTRTWLHPAIAWLTILGLAVANLALTGGLVVCEDGHGGARIEWSCDRNADGECLTRCTDDDGHDTPRPCDDSPLQGGQETAKAPPRTSGGAQAVISAPPVVVVWTDTLAPEIFVRASRGPTRPPDVLGRIRTVILVV